MIRLEILLGLVTLCLFVFCLVDVVQTPGTAVRNLPKVAWVLLVLVFPFVGSVAWLVAGRPEKAARRSAYERSVPEFPEYDRPGRAVANDPAGDEEFLRQVRERADEQRRRHEERKRAREREEQSGSTPPPADEA